MTIEATLPQLLRRNAEKMPDRHALREKDLGIWQAFSWRRYWEEVRDLALGLAAAGFGQGDKLSVIGENRPRLYFAQLAAMSLGGIAVPVYQDAIASELARLRHAEFVARAERYRLKRSAGHPSQSLRWPHLRASLRHLVHRSHARAAAP